MIRHCSIAAHSRARLTAGCKPRWYQNHYKTVNNAKTRSRLACFARIACEVDSYIRAVDADVVIKDS